MINGFDIVLCVGLIAFTVNGFARGLIAKVLSLAALLAGIILAARFGKEISIELSRYTGLGRTFSGVIGVSLLFVVLFVIAGLLGKGLRKVAIFKVWDKFGGAVFGFLEGALLLSLLLLILAVFDIPPSGPALDRSIVYKPVKNFAPEIYRAFVANSSTERYLDKFFFFKRPRPK